jgi:hypothetical protein
MLDAVAQIFLGRIDQPHDLRPSVALFDSAILDLTIVHESAVFHVTSFFRCSAGLHSLLRNSGDTGFVITARL